MTTVIIGVGFTAMFSLFQTCTENNRLAGQMTSAMNLANNIQETMAGLSFNDPIYASKYFGPEPGETLATYNDVDDFDGQTFNPPVNSQRAAIAAMNQFTQVVSVVPVYATKLSSNTDPNSPEIPKTTYTGAVRVTVRILYRARTTDPNVEVYRHSWIRVDG